MQHRALYAAFDRYPSAKGAAVHISKMAEVLFRHAGGGLLYVLGDELLPRYQREGDIEIVRFTEPITNFLVRALRYGDRLAEILEAHAQLSLCHFRDPWSGVPIVTHPARRFRTVYEINGLPSIELPYAYPQIGQTTLDKIRAAEQLCWSEADVVITPSSVLRDNLVGLGVPEGKIHVLPNGADLIDAVPPPPADLPARYLLYFGALQRWQGIDVLLQAFSRLTDFPDLSLVLCCSGKHRNLKQYSRLARRLRIEERLVWRFGLSQEELLPVRCHALLSLAPLTECSRNLEQGMCPLKILESMAAGVPVLASDLPAVRELVEDGVSGKLVRPDRPQELARAVRVLLEYPEMRRDLGLRARDRIRDRFTWTRTQTLLADLYQRLLDDN